ncbi:MAG: carboxypeptidase-like regulatory domain-containing protein, partial [Acidobacteriota bacterium]|nr:carboxypeptidase-like regulatory domain-containing protein [Acidobacteriota bacterium]
MDRKMSGKPFGFVLALLFAPVLLAQDSTARLLGTVTDPSGAVIPGASVLAHNLATGLERKAVSNEAGDYSIPLLPIGQYTVNAEANGFKTSTINGLVLQVNQEARLDIKLALGTAGESIEVQAASPLLVTDSSSVGQVIENVAIANLPLNGRAFWQLAQLTPGAVYTPGGQDITSGGQGIRASRVQLRISGSSRLAGGWLLDGFDITEYEQGGTSISPSTDALEEFKVMAGGMSAEYQLPSVINAVLKSGSNSFNGSLYEYLRNDKLQARNFFAQTVPELRRNEFGATLGGPIKRDKIFFFADYEGGRTRQGTTQNSIIPTPQQLNGVFTGLRPIYDPLTTRVNPANPSQFLRDQFPNNAIPANRLSPQALYFKSWFPAPNSAGNRFIYSPALSLDTDKFDVKVSPRLTEKDSLVSRYSYIDNTERDVQGYPVLGYYPLHSRAQNVGLSYVHIFSPNLTMESAASYYRMFFYFLNASNFNGKDVISMAGITGYDGISNLQPSAPMISLSGYTTIAGNTDNRPKANRIRTYEYRTSMSWVKGNHNMKFGAQLTHQAHAFLNGNGSQGTMTFNGQYTQNPLSAGSTGDSVADFLLGDPSAMQRATPQQIFGVSGDFWSFYGQDDYRVSRNLTLNLGLRWELNSWYTGIRGQTNAFDFATGKIIIPTKNGTPDLTAQPGEAQNWAVFRPLLETTEQLHLPYSIRPADDRCPGPRIGLAWKPFGSEKSVVRSAYGIFYIYADTNQLQPLYRTPPFNLIQVINNDVPTASTLVPRRNLADYFLGQPLASLGSTPSPTTTRTFFRSAYTQTWNLNLQHEFGNNLAGEIAYVGNKGTRLEYSSAGNVPLPGPGNVQGRRPYPNWGVFLFQEWGGSSTYHSLQTKLERRFSGGLSLLAAYTYSKCLDGPGSEEGASPAYYLDRLNKGPCSFDVPHNFVTSYVWQLPISSSSRALNFIVGGWQWQGI